MATHNKTLNELIIDLRTLAKSNAEANSLLEELEGALTCPLSLECPPLEPVVQIKASGGLEPSVYNEGFLKEARTFLNLSPMTRQPIVNIIPAAAFLQPYADRISTFLEQNAPSKQSVASSQPEENPSHSSRSSSSANLAVPVYSLNASPHSSQSISSPLKPPVVSAPSSNRNNFLSSGPSYSSSSNSLSNSPEKNRKNELLKRAEEGDTSAMRQLAKIYEKEGSLSQSYYWRELSLPHDWYESEQVVSAPFSNRNNSILPSGPSHSSSSNGRSSSSSHPVPLQPSTPFPSSYSSSSFSSSSSSPLQTTTHPAISSLLKSPVISAPSSNCNNSILPSGPSYSSSSNNRSSSSSHPAPLQPSTPFPSSYSSSFSHRPLQTTTHPAISSLLKPPVVSAPSSNRNNSILPSGPSHSSSSNNRSSSSSNPLSSSHSISNFSSQENDRKNELLKRAEEEDVSGMRDLAQQYEKEGDLGQAYHWYESALKKKDNEWRMRIELEDPRDDYMREAAKKHMEFKFGICTALGNMSQQLIDSLTKYISDKNRSSIGLFLFGPLSPKESDDRQLAYTFIQKLNGNSYSEKFSQAQVETLLSGDFGKILKQFPWVMEKLQNEWTEPQAQNAAAPRRNNK